MTPEEKAVIEAAIAWGRFNQASTGLEWEIDQRLMDAVSALPVSATYYEPDPEWIETTMRQALTGDRIRIGLEEAEVIRCSSGIWQASVSDAWHPQGWEHVEFRAELSTVPGFVQYPPNASIEILCTPERKAILLLQDAFPGSAVTSSDVN